VVGPLAEAVAWLGDDGAGELVSELEALVEKFGLGVAGPQLLRARARLLARDRAPREALDALEASATLARSQHAVVDLAQTLAMLAPLARQVDRGTLAADADAERQVLLQQLGPKTDGLVWAAPGLAHHDRKKVVVERGGPLSAREREVAGLIVRGLSNRQIAASLVISERTVENHVRSILARLGVDTRAQVAVWAVQHGLAPNPQ
jgi:DNA-binding NarL/FixJ family response regulator